MIFNEMTESSCGKTTMAGGSQLVTTRHEKRSVKHFELQGQLRRYSFKRSDFFGCKPTNDLEFNMPRLRALACLASEVQCNIALLLASPSNRKALNAKSKLNNSLVSFAWSHSRNTYTYLKAIGLSSNRCLLHVLLDAKQHRSTNYAECVKSC